MVVAGHAVAQQYPGQLLFLLTVWKGPLDARTRGLCAELRIARGSAETEECAVDRIDLIGSRLGENEPVSV